MKLKKIIHDIELYLGPQGYHDSSYNGLQVEGNPDVTKIIIGVSACEEIFKEAIKNKAELVLVHHGLFWEGSDPRIKGFIGKRVSLLLKHNISLAAFHLSLDAHNVVGNCMQICKKLSLKKIAPWGFYKPAGIIIGYKGECQKTMTVSSFVKLVNDKLETKSIVLPFGGKTIRSVAVVSGAAGLSFVNQAIESNVDVLVTGELNEPMYHLAKEAGIHVVGAGHYATERWGVKALGEWIKKKYDIKCTFVEVDNPL